MTYNFPPLPEPDTHCWDEDAQKDCWSFSADQMRVYAQAALDALADEAEASIKAMIEEGLGQLTKERPTDAELQRRTGEPHIDGWPLYSGLPPPARVPLTDEQIDQITAQHWRRGLGAPYAAYRAYARAIEAAHGIGPLTVADLEQSRQVNPGAIWTPRGCPPCIGNCSQGRDCHPMPAEACTEIGIESMLRYRRTTLAVAWGIALALTLVLIGYLLQTVYPFI